MTLMTLDDLFFAELKDIYYAEKRLLKTLPKMAKSAASAPLRRAFTSHAKETERQVERLEKVFALLDKAARGKKCEAMEGLLGEGSELMEEEATEAVHDAGLICAAQKVEHYEIATYGTLIAWAKTLGHKRIAQLLTTTLGEEEAADKKLTKLAGTLNFEAAEEPEPAETAPRMSFLTELSHAVGLG